MNKPCKKNDISFGENYLAGKKDNQAKQCNIPKQKHQQPGAEA
jgi:hypothetical protein